MVAASTLLYRRADRVERKLGRFAASRIIKAARAQFLFEREVERRAASEYLRSFLSEEQNHIIAVDGLICRVDRRPSPEVIAARSRSPFRARLFASGRLQPPEAVGIEAPFGAYVRRYL